MDQVFGTLQHTSNVSIKSEIPGTMVRVDLSPTGSEEAADCSSSPNSNTAQARKHVCVRGDENGGGGGQGAAAAGGGGGGAS